MNNFKIYQSIDNAVYNNNVDQLIVLLDEYFNPIQTSTIIMYLIEIVIRYNRTSILKLLMDKYNVNITKCDPDVLTVACNKMSYPNDDNNYFLDMLQFFIDIGIDITCDIDRNFMKALSAGLFSVAKFFLSHGANINAINDTNFSAYCINWLDKSIKLESQQKLFYTITELVTNYNFNYQDENVFNAVCSSNHINYATELINLGMTVDSLTQSTISFIVQCDYYHLMEILIKYGLDMMKIDPVSVMELILGRYENNKMFDLLIMNGYNFSSFHLSSSEKTMKKINILLNNGFQMETLLCMVIDNMDILTESV